MNVPAPLIKPFGYYRVFDTHWTCAVYSNQSSDIHLGYTKELSARSIRDRKEIKKWVFYMIFSVSVGNILFGIFQEGAFSPEGGLYPAIVLDIFFLLLILMGLLSVSRARRRIRQLHRQPGNEH